MGADPEPRPALSEAARRILERSGLGAPAVPATPPRVPSAFARAESEDDDGYDPYSDRPAAPEDLWQADPWS